MRFNSYSNLRLFNVVANHLSFTAAARELNLTKGAVSYQVKRLEDDLGFEVFLRGKRGIVLTDKGRRLLSTSQSAFNDLERQITHLRQQDARSITIGMATYFASRWLSPRLMRFITNYPSIGLRIQPLIDLTDLRKSDIDMAIRWGKGDWSDTGMQSELLFPCPAMLTAGTEIARDIEEHGIQAAIENQTLLHDRDGSIAWQDWYQVAGLEYSHGKDNLVIPDPNVRVQAVIDNQGIALYDFMVANEILTGQLFQYPKFALNEYGYYLVYPDTVPDDSAIMAFRDWIKQEATRAGESAI